MRRPRRIPPQEKMAKLYEMKATGLPSGRIATLSKGTTWEVDRSTRLDRWLSEPLLNPHVDPVAVSRALAGDVAVYDSLTYYEQDIVWEKLALEIDRDFTHALAGLGTKADEALLGRFGKGSRRVFEDVKRWRDRAKHARRRAG